MKKYTCRTGTLAVWCVLGVAVMSNAQTAPLEKRFPQLTLEQLSGPARTLAEDIGKVSSIGLTGPYNLMLRSPVMGDRLFELLRYLRWETSMPLRLNELAILIQGRRQTSQVIWYAHDPIAKRAGLSELVIADLREGRRPRTMQPDEEVVYDFCTELSTTHGVSDATWQRTKKMFTDQQIVDLIATSGTYVTVSMLANAGLEPAPGGQMPLPPLP